MADSPLEEDRFELPVPPKTPGILAVVLSRSRRLSLAEKPLPESARRPTKVRNRCAADVETIRRNSALRRFGSLPSRGRRFADVRRMHQAGWFVKHISDELEFELFQDFLRSTIVRVMPSVDLRQSQFFPGVFERAERCFRCEALAPAALHEMERSEEIRVAGRIEPRPKSAADFLLTFKGSLSGQPFSPIDLRRTVVWVKQKENWKVVAWQVTRAPEGK